MYLFFLFQVEMAKSQLRTEESQLSVEKQLACMDRRIVRVEQIARDSEAVSRPLRKVVLSHGLLGSTMHVNIANLMRETFRAQLSHTAPPTFVDPSDKRRMIIGDTRVSLPLLNMDHVFQFESMLRDSFTKETIVSVSLLGRPLTRVISYLGPFHALKHR